MDATSFMENTGEDCDEYSACEAIFGILGCMDNAMQWYAQLIKPSWAPPAWLFGPVWSVLYLGIAISFSATAILFFRGKIPFIVLLPFILNLVFNFAFSPIQFGLRSNVLASVDILLVLATLVWAIVAIRPAAPWIAYAQLPYLAWVSFATVLQFTITYLNHGR